MRCIRAFIYLGYNLAKKKEVFLISYTNLGCYNLITTLILAPIPDALNRSDSASRG